jgi:hypothetical protein
MNLREITPPYFLWRFGEEATVGTQDLTSQSHCHYAHAITFTASLSVEEEPRVEVVSPVLLHGSVCRLVFRSVSWGACDESWISSRKSARTSSSLE